MKNNGIYKSDGNFDHAAFMQTPSHWPNWPVLPVKRYTKDHGFPQTGLLVDAHGAVVYLGNLFAAQNIHEWPKEEFNSFDDLLAAGWQVD